MAYTAKDLYLNGLARYGMNFPDALVGESNAKGVYSILTSAITEFYLTHDWDFLLTTTTINTASGTATYNLPSDFDTLYGITIPALNLELKGTQIRKIYKYGTTQGIPRYFYVTNGTFTVAPIPSDVNAMKVFYYKNIPHPNATDQGSSGLYAYLATISYASLIPEWARPLAELYVAKGAALLLKDRDGFGMISGELQALRSIQDDDVRKSTAPVPPATRYDWNQ